MKIDSLAIQGFRGFNQQQTLAFHPELTLIYGQNSYGKTSITEAVEWLLYGKTSKVDRGESKEEYKGSYRNCHLDDIAETIVTMCCSSKDKPTKYECALVGEDGFARRVDDSPVEKWPINAEAAAISRPFIMQHALKYLLLVGPTDRFKGFARLLSLDELGDMQSDFVSVCTKPTASLPQEVVVFRTRMAALENRLAACDSLKKIYSQYKKGIASYSSFLSGLSNECKSRVPEGTTDDSILPSLLRIRDEAAKKVFPGSIVLAPYSGQDSMLDLTDQKCIIEFASEDLIRKYCGLVALNARETIIKEAQFYKIGMEFLNTQPPICPFCGQGIDDSVLEHIGKKHQNLEEETEHSSGLLAKKKELTNELTELKQRLDKCQQRHLSRLSKFITIEDSLKKLSEIFLPKYEQHYLSVRDTLVALKTVKEELEHIYFQVIKSLAEVQQSIDQSKEETSLIEDLGKKLVSYSNAVSSNISSVSGFVSPMSDANEMLKHEVDSVAGIEDVSLLIDLNEKIPDIKKYLQIDNILDGVKELRKTIDQYVGSKMLEAVTNEMTKDVMQWYSQIRTTTDPDVHFSGFDMDRTTKGDIKSRSIQIRASSYGKDLVSAVSSLSESKLNALGICVSVATNLKPDCPFDFIFIDDPIQSWDDEHGAQFIEVIRNLVEKGKQVILLSHNKKWLEQVRDGCRSLNGYYYEITSYNQNGPNIEQKAWCSWKQRLNEIDGILKDTTADSIRLQHAEEEIRLVVTDLTSVLYYKIKTVRKNANGLNADKVRKCLLECGLPIKTIDNIGQTFVTADDSHHVTDYVAQRERIKRYHGYATELSNHCK